MAKEKEKVMNGFVKPDKDLEKAFRKMAKECVKKQKGEGLPYVKATNKETEKVFKEMGAKEKLDKKLDDNTLVMY